MKKRSERRKHCALAVVRWSQKFCPASDPLPGGAGRSEFNQLEMVTTFTYKPSLVRIDARKFQVIVYRGNRPTHTPSNTACLPDHCKRTGPITIHCTAASSRCNHASANVSTQWRNVSHRARREYRMLSMSRNVLFDKRACESSRLLCGLFCTCLDHSYV